MTRSAQRDAVTVVVDMDPCVEVDAPGPSVVLAAAAQLFGRQDPVRVVCAVPGEPTESDLMSLMARFAAVVPDLGQLPETVMMGHREAADVPAVLRVSDAGDSAAQSRAVVLLAGLAQSFAEEPVPDRGEPAPAAASRFAVARGFCDAARAEHDAARRASGDERIRVLVPVQHPNTWGALAPLVDAAALHPRVDLHLVAMDSVHSRTRGEVADFLGARGLASRDEDWAQAHLAEADLAVLVDPYDEFRPEGLRVPDLLARGVRVVCSPYAHNIGGDPDGLARQYDSPLHNLAWRVYVASDVQQQLFAEHCDAGDAHVRSLGSVKAEWLLDGPSDGSSEWASTWSPDRTVLWNPHYSVGDGGWSTFGRYLDALLGFFEAHPEAGLVVRPHFRLLPVLEEGGPALRRLAARVRSSATDLANVHLDEDRDYRAAMHVSDAMVSDLSSLIPEYLALGRPVGYLTHSSYTATTAHDDWRAAVEVIEDTQGLEDFLVRATAARGEGGSCSAPPPVRALAARGTGRRVLDAVVGDYVQEVWRA